MKVKHLRKWIEGIDPEAEVVVSSPFVADEDGEISGVVDIPIVGLAENTENQNELRFVLNSKDIKSVFFPGEVKLFNRHGWPRTFDEAVVSAEGLLSESDKLKIGKMPETDIIDLHFSLGLAIRNEFGLWEGNSALLEDCGKVSNVDPPGSIHPDDASQAILVALAEKLRQEGN